MGNGKLTGSDQSDDTRTAPRGRQDDHGGKQERWHGWSDGEDLGSRRRPGL